MAFQSGYVTRQAIAAFRTSRSGLSTKLIVPRAIEAIFGGPASAPEVPADDLRMLFKITGGNPYFLTEMLRLLQTDGAIDRRDELRQSLALAWHP